MIMKHQLLKSFIIVLLFSVAGFAFADTDNVIINNLSNVLMHTEYDCKVLNTSCVVDKINNVQTGEIFYDAECNASHMTKSTYENDVINDVKTGYLRYCTMKTRTLKGAN